MIISNNKKMAKCLILRCYLNEWREYKNKENIQRQNELRSELYYSRHRLIQCYNFWKYSVKNRIYERKCNEKADLFFISKIQQKQCQILFGNWYCYKLQQQDIKQRIIAKYRQNVMRKYINEWIAEYEYNQIIKLFKLKWDKLKYRDIYLKIFIVWKKQCKYQISLLNKIHQFENNKQCKIFQKWYLTVYKKQKLAQCQNIANKVAIKSEFVQWKITMKHHLDHKRKEIFITNKHRIFMINETLKTWKGFVNHKQNTKTYKISLKNVGDSYIFRKFYTKWNKEYQLILKMKITKKIMLKIQCVIIYVIGRSIHELNKNINISYNQHNNYIKRPF